MTTWRMTVELEFPVQPTDIVPMFHGDAEVDFARRAMERVRPALERLLTDIGPEAHYQLRLPERARGQS